MSQSFRAGSPAKNSGRANCLDGLALAAYLARRHRHCTAGYVAARTGIAEATVRDWLIGRCRPSTPHLLTLVAAYGIGLLEAAWPKAPPEIAAAARAGEIAALKAEIASAHARLAALDEASHARA